MESEVIILKNQPEENSCGQYNLGKLEDGDPFQLLGKQYHNLENVNTDLYAIHEQKTLNTDPQDGNDGLFWNYIRKN